MPLTRNTQRRLGAIAAILAAPFYVACAWHHVCKHGHMQHPDPPYGVAHYANDAAWIILFLVGMVLLVRSATWFGRIVGAVLFVLLVTRMGMVYVWGFWGCFGEMPAMLGVCVAAIIMMLRRRIKPRPDKSAQQL